MVLLPPPLPPSHTSLTGSRLPHQPAHLLYVPHLHPFSCVPLPRILFQDIPGSSSIPAANGSSPPGPAATPSSWHPFASPGTCSSSAAARQVHPSGVSGHGKEMAETPSSHFQALIPRGLAVPEVPGFLCACGSASREVSTICIWMGQEAEGAAIHPARTGSQKNCSC